MAGMATEPGRERVMNPTMNTIDIVVSDMDATIPDGNCVDLYAPLPAG
jgi:hypothetical protein